jgi:Bacterial SH3 domain
MNSAVENKKVPFNLKVSRLACLLGCGVVLASTSSNAVADVLYVSDTMVINAYAEANQDSSKITSLKSGDVVEALDKAEGYTRVRMRDGKEGWVKSSYLTAHVPAVVQLREGEKARASDDASPNTALQEELQQLKTQNAALQNEIATLSQAQVSTPIAAPTTATNQTGGSMEGHLEGIESVTTEPPPFLGVKQWSLLAAALLVSAGLGYTLGYQALARRIRRKYGNVKIY